MIFPQGESATTLRVKETITGFCLFCFPAKCCTTLCFTMSSRTSSAIRIAHAGMSPDEIVTNIMDGVSEIAKIIPRGWTNIQSLNIKSSDSIALPIHTSLPDNIESIVKKPRAKKRKVEEKKKTEKKNKKKKLEVEDDNDGSEDDSD